MSFGKKKLNFWIRLWERHLRNDEVAGMPVRTMLPPLKPAVDGVRPIEAEACTEAEARAKLEEFFKCYERGGGANLRVELARGLPGIRFVLVGSWDDMS